MDQLALVALLGSLVSKVVDFVRWVRARDWNAVVLQLVTWVVGVALMFLAGASDYFGQVVLPVLEVPLADLDGYAKVLAGMSIASLLGVVIDFQKSIDSTQSADRPPLIEDGGA